MKNNSIWIFIFITIFAGIAAGLIAANAPGGASPPDSSGSEDPPVPPDPPAQIYNVQIFVESGSEPVDVYDGQDSTGELLATLTYDDGGVTVQCQSAYIYMTSSADTLNSETLSVTDNLSIEYELNYGEEGYDEAWEALFSVSGDGTIQGLMIEEYEAQTGGTVAITVGTDMYGPYYVYDGQDDTGTLLETITQSDFEYSITCTSGNLFFKSTEFCYAYDPDVTGGVTNDTENSDYGNVSVGITFIVSGNGTISIGLND